MTGKIFLSGGGDEIATKMLDEMFFAELPQNSNILYVATGFRESEKITSASEWMQDMINMHGRTDIHYLFADDLTPFRHLNDYHAIYIGGGDTNILMDEFDRTGFEFVLQDFSRHGGIIYGGGGGAITLGKFIDTGRDIHRQYKTGVELLGRYSVYTDYHDENKDGWATSHDSLLLCLPSGVGVVIEDGKITRNAGRNYKIFEL